jgi:hypothetical protein
MSMTWTSGNGIFNVDRSLAKDDFGDTREFVAKRWEDAVFALSENLSVAGKSTYIPSVLIEMRDC